MKLLRFLTGTKSKWGVLTDGTVREIEWENEIFGNYKVIGKEISLEGLTLLSPCEPSKIIGIGLNYHSHAEEVGLAIPEVPVVFMMPSTSVVGHNDDILMPPQSKRVDYEAELGIVIGKKARNVSEDQAREHILGYTCCNDVTARDLQPKDGQWVYAKSFDTFAPIGPWIETDIEDPTTMTVEGYLNGKLVQKGSVDDMIFSIEKMVSYLSSCMTLLPGDVIMTGTPSGIGPLKEGDVFTVKIDKIGNLTNKAVKA